jgi:hypothetical protein
MMVWLQEKKTLHPIQLLMDNTAAALIYRQLGAQSKNV